MIIDSHYHFIYSMNEAIAREMIKYALHGASITGMKVDQDDLLKRAIDTLADPTGERLIDSMDEAGVDLSVVCMVDNANLPRLSREIVEKINKTLSNMARKNEGRVIDLAGIDPRRPEAVDMAKLYLEGYGMKGFKYHADHGYDPAGPESYRILEVLAKNKGILLSHTSPLMLPMRCNYAESMLLADIGVDFPEIKVIAAHSGGYINWRSWASLALFQATLYGDLAMWDNLAISNYELFCRELRTAIDFVGPSKILFGSDAPIQTLLMPLKEWVGILKGLPDKAPEGISFTEDEVDLILGGNAADVLNLKAD